MDRPQQDDSSLIGESPAFLEVLEHASSVAQLNRPVLVVGERGTGKELVAARVHYLSSRWDKAFIKINCAALSETLLESELFGHESGSFTGATRQHKGRFELADHGTLFLDELANTSSRVQEKILRVIEYGEFERVGGSKSIRTDTRLVAATNADLPGMAAAGEFRADLLDRLSFDVITLPPLRQRGDDILRLAEHFAKRMASELSHELFPGFSRNAEQALSDHPWPGNVRELKNTVERAVYRYGGSEEQIDKIQFDPFESPYRLTHGVKPVKPLATDNATGAANPSHSIPTEAIDFKQTVKDFEVEILRNALEVSKFNQRKAAEHLGLTYHQLRGYLRKYELLGE
jgi:psp operon transcriptional activator